MVQILGIDIAGHPVKWLTPQAAAALVTTGRVAWQCGAPAVVLRGGRNRHGERSMLAISGIVGLDGRRPKGWLRNELPLTNELLFRRDCHLCAYCGQHFRSRDLSRDHVVPRVQGGADRWTNVVTACRACNQRKGGRRPEETRDMQLLYVPYAPCLWEHFLLSSRDILADQMEFLAARLPSHSRLRSRLTH